jgi:para-aminobenzoate synthetase component I
MFYPTVQAIDYRDPLEVFAYFSKSAGAIFLDSAACTDSVGRYSFIAIDPFTTFISKNSAVDPFAQLATLLKRFECNFHPDLPPFQGGIAGFFSYDLCHYLEKIPRHDKDELQFPDMAVGLYDLVIAFDHGLQQSWIFSSGFPADNSQERNARAHQRLRWLEHELTQIPELSPILKELPPTSITANFTASAYQAAVRQVQEYILAGDIFEANIAQCFRAELSQTIPPFELYRHLRALNPAPFAAYLNFNDTIIASASPERFLKLTADYVESRPIKGTQPRGKTLAEDEALKNLLMQSQKDKAENVMIVDLLRNDLSRVCADGSVCVPQLCGLESFATVHHLVSVVTGKLLKNMTAIDLLRATFPGGSITGAPKIRAMEIIAAIEPTARGPYCGSIGYIGFNGDMDSSIVIRTFALKNNKISFQAGGAIVLDSDPQAEYEETLTKARALRQALSAVKV